MFRIRAGDVLCRSAAPIRNRARAPTRDRKRRTVEHEHEHDCDYESPAGFATGLTAATVRRLYGFVCCSGL
jgi:hypothetical protein